MHELLDFQNLPMVIRDDATETVVYQFTVTPALIYGVTLFRLQVSGSLTTRAVLPGSITMRYKLGNVTAVVMTETPLAGVSSAAFIANLDCWVMPGSIAVAAVGGFFAQNAADLLTTPGPRLSSAAGAVDISVDQTLQATFQFDTADPDNRFTRGLVSLVLLYR